MTEREKIIKAINSVQAYGIMSNAFGGDSPVTNEILADKLIEAGFGYVKDLKAKLRSKEIYIHELYDVVIKDYKHRAAVAEKALFDFYIKNACNPRVCAGGERNGATLQQTEKDIAEEKKQ